MSRASGSTDLIGSVAFVKECRFNLILSDKIFRLCIDEHRCHKEFLVWALGAYSSRQQIQQSISGAEGLANNITKSTIQCLVVALPPLEQQLAILTFLDSETEKIDALIAKAHQGIDLLKERRSALISAAVTGKIDVREFAKQAQPSAELVPA